MIRYSVELRSEMKGRTLRGHAAVFGPLAKVPGHYERMASTAFDAVLEDDIVALFNHDENFLLGRSSAGTLRVGTDSQGLDFEVDLPNTTVGRDVQELAERGDLGGASIGFIPGEDDWDVAPDGVRIRTHTKVKLLRDVSPVTFPAYSATDVALRNFEFERPNRGRSQLIRARARVRNG